MRARTGGRGLTDADWRTRTGVKKVRIILLNEITLNWDVLNMTFFMYLILIWKFCPNCLSLTGQIQTMMTLVTKANLKT